MSDFKYKVGDKVQIKDIDWYNDNKDENGFVNCGKHLFYPARSKFCGEIFTISKVFPNYYLMSENDYEWTNEMIECLVERNGKTYPYKIGDRVILKGSNRCATITDLKYNCQGNLSYYIKIDNDKDISTDCPTELLLPYDNMIECNVEEETPKYKVGDKVRIKSLGWYNENKDEYGNVSCEKYDFMSYMSEFCGKTLTIDVVFEDETYLMKEDNAGFVFTNEMIEGLVEEETKPQYEDEIELIGYFSPKQFICPIGYEFQDENGNVINAQKIVLKKKKPKYPNTYEECENILGLEDSIIEGCLGYEYKLLNAFQKLLMCRDAYWKIAGEEMGLDKPWKPDYSGTFEHGTPIKYVIYNIGTHIVKERKSSPNHILAFPTEEMASAFYENFKKEIEICKELL